MERAVLRGWRIGWEWERQLRGLFLQHLGASPVVLGQTRRGLFAKQLIHDYRPVNDRDCSGIRLQQPAAIQRSLSGTLSPATQFHPAQVGGKAARCWGAPVFRIRYRAPYDWESMLEFLRARAIPGIEVVEEGAYKRAVELGGRCGFIEVKHLPLRASLSVTIHFPRVQALHEIVKRVRRLFDLGADIVTTDEHLSLDKNLRPLVAKMPCLRAPGGFLFPFDFLGYLVLTAW